MLSPFYPIFRAPEHGGSEYEGLINNSAMEETLFLQTPFLRIYNYVGGVNSYQNSGYDGIGRSVNDQDIVTTKVCIEYSVCYGIHVHTVALSAYQNGGNNVMGKSTYDHSIIIEICNINLILYQVRIELACWELAP